MKTKFLLLPAFIFVSLSCGVYYLIADPDLWGHLTFGKIAVEEGKVLKTDLFSYTVAGRPVVHHEWLSESFLYLVYRAGGEAGLIAFKILTYLLLGFLVFIIARRFSENLFVQGTAWLLTMRILSYSSFFRPQLFTYILLAVFVFILIEHKRGSPLILLALTVFWANLHGGVMAGLGYLFMFALFSRNSFQTFALCSLGTLVNPYGIHLWEGLLRAIMNPLTRKYIVEWQPLPLWSIDIPEYKILLVLLCALYIAFKKSLDIPRAHVIAALAAAGFSILSRRHIPLFAILSLPLLCRLLTLFFSKYPRLGPGFFVPLLAWSISIGILLWPKDLRIQKEKNAYPVGTVEFMKQNKLSGNVFNTFNWGEYLIYHLYPRVKVSVDGRYDTAYPFGVLEKNFEPLIQKNSSYHRIPWQSKTHFVLIQRKKPLALKLFKDRRWQFLYRDQVSVLFGKKQVVKNRKFIRPVVTPENKRFFP